MNGLREENFCTFCHTIVPRSEINDSIEELLLVLFIKKTSDRVVACPYCTRKLNEFCEFKLCCLIGEEKLYDYKKTEDETLNTLFLKIHGPSRCRFCKVQTPLAQITRLPHFLDQYGIAEIIQKHLFEVDISEANGSIMCKSCIDIISDFKSFLKRCELLPKLNLPIRSNGLSNNAGISEIVMGVFFECQYCGCKKISRENYERHIRVLHKDCMTTSSHEPLLYRCYLCDVKKEHEVDLVQHIELKHMTSKRCEDEADKRGDDCIANKIEFFECYLCGDRKGNKPGLINHIKSVHFRHRYHWKAKFRGKLKGIDKGTRLNKRHFPVTSGEIIEKKCQSSIYKCNVCDIRTRTKAALMNHIKFKHKKEWQLKHQRNYEKRTEKAVVSKSNHRIHKSTLKIPWLNHMKLKHAAHMKQHMKLKKNCEWSKYIINGKAFKVIRENNCLIFECKACGFKSPEKQSLLQHVRLNHMRRVIDRGKSKCTICDFTCNKRYMSTHMRIKHNMNACDKSTALIADKINQWFECHLCGSRKKNENDFILHIQEAHYKDRHIAEEKKCINKPDVELLRKNNHTNSEIVELTNPNCESTKSLEIPTSAENKPGLETPTNIKPMNNNVIDLEQIKSNRHITSKKTTGQHSLRNECPICQFKAKRKGALVLHMKYKHEKSVHFDGESLVMSDIINDKLFECYLCSVKKKTKTALQMHITRCHFRNRWILKKPILMEAKLRNKCYSNNEKPVKESKTNEKVLFECAVCGAKKGNKASLTKHMTLLHSRLDNSAVFKCEICGFQTHWKHGFTSHLKFKHKNSFDLNHEYFKCYLCAAIKTSRLKLIQHIESRHQDIYGQETNNHQFFKCCFCGAETKRKDTLLHHIECKHQNTKIDKSKSVSKTFLCSSCGTEHENRESLLTHVCKLTQIFICNLCGTEHEDKKCAEENVVIQQGKCQADSMCDINNSSIPLCDHVSACQSPENCKSEDEIKIILCSLCGTVHQNNESLLTVQYKEHEPCEPDFCDGDHGKASLTVSLNQKCDKNDESNTFFLCAACHEEHENERSLLKHECIKSHVFFCQSCGTEHEENVHCEKESQSIHEKECQEVDSVLLPRSVCNSESQCDYTQHHMAKRNMSCNSFRESVTENIDEGVEQIVIMNSKPSNNNVIGDDFLSNIVISESCDIVHEKRRLSGNYFPY